MKKIGNGLFGGFTFVSGFGMIVVGTIIPAVVDRLTHPRETRQDIIDGKLSW